MNPNGLTKHYQFPFFILLLLVVVTHLSACRPSEPEQFEWLPGVDAAEAYPIKIIGGQFKSVNGYSPQLPTSDFVNSGWGATGGIMAVGPDKRAVPDSLSITWLSFAERKIYRGSFILPKKRLTELFREGYVYHETNAKEEYNYLVLGLSPGGHIVLWIAGGRKQVLVATFKATEVKLSAKDVDPDDRYLFLGNFITESYERNVPRKLRDSIKVHKILPEIFQQWQKKYSWHFKVNDNAVKFDQLAVTYLNAELEQLFDAALLKNGDEQRAVPKSLWVVWFDRKKQKMATEVVFDETEIRNAFSNLAENTSAELNCVIDPEEYAISILLKAGTKEIRLKKQSMVTTLLEK